MNSIRGFSFSRAFLLAAILLGSVSACGGDSTRAQDTACTTPVRGSRYGVCGGISTGGISTGTGATVAGSTDAAPGDTAGRYSIVGGTFHAYP